jgi:hypothetical protein
MSFMQVQLSVNIDRFFSKGMLQVEQLTGQIYQNIKDILIVTCI